MAGNKKSGNRSERRGHRARSVIRIDAKTAKMLAEYQQLYAEEKPLDEIAILAIRGYCRETPTAQETLNKALSKH